MLSQNKARKIQPNTVGAHQPQPQPQAGPT